VTSSQIDVVLFDLGGVLVDFGGVGPMRELTGIATDEELWQRWLTSPWVRKFERGHCSPEDFATGIVKEWGLDISPDPYLIEFQSWPAGPLAGADLLLDDVQRSLPVGCLSNTNALQWSSHFAEWPILNAFDFSFLSFEMGMVKPDRELFEQVTKALATPPGRILFLDDNSLNVEAAIRCGFASLHVRGVQEARSALVDLGVLDA
jgi:HAD superfamily hydrolase (TIGR01509 family)